MKKKHKVLWLSDVELGTCYKVKAYPVISEESEYYYGYCLLDRSMVSRDGLLSFKRTDAYHKLCFLLLKNIEKAQSNLSRAISEMD